jgi:type VII secretion protein EccB
VATRKDQLDAFNFARRRMVANLVVPTATGSDEGAPRPVKTFASSIILSAIAVAAVAVLGVFKPSAPSGWQNGLAVDSSTGAAYIVQNNELHAVVNITSARLILGTNFKKYDVPDSTLNNSGMSIGAPVGILGAPEDVPSAASMTLTQWSLCQHESDASDQTVANGPTYLEIGYGPSSSTTTWTSTGGPSDEGSNVALIVHDSGQNAYLVDGNYKYYVGNTSTTAGADDVRNLLTAVHAGSSLVLGETGFWVSDAWLDAFTLGDPITYPTLTQTLNSSVTSSLKQPGTAVGQYNANPGLNGGGTVQTANGVLELSSFAYDLYAGNPALTTDSVQKLNASSLTQSAITEANGVGAAPTTSNVLEQNTYGPNWPQLPPSSLVGTDTASADTQNICVGYSGTSANGVPQLTTWVSASLPYGTASGTFGLTQSTSNREATTVLVKPGYGLLAQGSSGGAGAGTIYLVEDSGYRYGLGTQTSTSTASGSSSSTTVSARTLLGYSNSTVETVPSTWISLIQGGAMLNPNDAGKNPSSGD